MTCSLCAQRQERIIELARDRDLWKRQARDLHHSSYDTPGPYEAHLYLVAAREAEAALDRQGTRLAFAERLVRGWLSGKQPSRSEIDDWQQTTKETT